VETIIQKRGIAMATNAGIRYGGAAIARHHRLERSRSTRSLAALFAARLQVIIPTAFEHPL
jgi:hypothetical protein